MTGRKRRPRSARFNIKGIGELEYKNIAVLQRFLTERGKILSRRVSGLSAKEQRALTTAVKRARFLGLLPSGGSR